jgi:hypothetical protein
MNTPTLSQSHATATAVRRRRGWYAAAAAVVMALSGTAAVTLPVANAAKHRSPCESGTAVGEICHYVSVVSEGDDYDVHMEMIDANGYPVRDVKPWNEKNPKFTRWFWRYSEDGTPDFSLNFQLWINDKTYGFQQTLPPDSDTCFQISKVDHRVYEVTCPLNDGVG